MEVSTRVDYLGGSCELTKSFHGIQLAKYEALILDVESSSKILRLVPSRILAVWSRDSS